MLTTTLIVFAYGVAILVTWFSVNITESLYGVEYKDASVVLAIHIWGALFVFLGLAQRPWNIAEGLLTMVLHRTLLGAGVNVVLNLILIPKYGGIGAAIATVVSYVIANYLSNGLSRATYPIFLMQTKALLLLTVWSYLKRRAKYV